ncbi:MAG TPA: hypothetical protein VKE70_26535 [Candidatus Solibacter sp.]|nr:hypothetical protein [Candidatus Solibacter sp.]
MAIFVDGARCGTVRAAYDSASGHAINFDTVAADLRASITRDYNVTADELRANGGDVFKWATYAGNGHPNRGTNEFLKRYPLKR